MKKFPVSFRHEEVSPEKYLELRQANAIKSAKIIPPQLGEEGFGRFEVVYRKLQYKTLDEQRPF